MATAIQNRAYCQVCARNTDPEKGPKGLIQKGKKDVSRLCVANVLHFRAYKDFVFTTFSTACFD